MPYRGRQLDCYDAGTFCPPAQQYMSSAKAAVPTPIKRQREVRLPGIKLTGNAPRTELSLGSASGRSALRLVLVSWREQPSHQQ
jgi:hypothetical protein